MPNTNAFEERQSYLHRLYGLMASDRQRLEDFLTENLGALLSEMRPNELLQLLEHVLLKGVDESAKARWVELAKESRRIEVRTQVSIRDEGPARGRRPDIVVFGDSGPILVLECKVGAGFTSLAGEADSNEPDVSQLELYEKWLLDHGDNRAALVLLTHSTLPPEEFLVFAEDRLAARSVCRWSEIARYLGSIQKTQPATQPWLAGQFVRFLEEASLSPSPLSLADVAAARLYVGSNTKFVECVKRATALIRAPTQYLPGKFSHSAWNIFADAYEAYLYATIYDPADSDVGIGWGFWFNLDVQADWKKDYEPGCRHTAGPIVYIEHYRPFHSGLIPAVAGWNFPMNGIGRKDAFNVCSFDEFLGHPDSSERISVWLKERFFEAVDIFKALEKR